MAKLAWDKVTKVESKSQSGGVRKVELGKKAIGRTYHLRPVGSPIAFFGAFVRDLNGKVYNLRIDLDEDGSDTTKRNHPLVLQYNVPFKLKYAINVYDTDEKLTKILEGGASIFGEFKKYKDYLKKEPGGVNGGLFTIKVTGQKGKDYYKMQIPQEYVFTDEERQAIKKSMYPLEKFYVPTKDEVWQELIEIGIAAAPAEGEEYSQNIPQAKGAAAANVRSAATSAPARQSAPTSPSRPAPKPVQNDDSFGEASDEAPPF